MEITRFKGFHGDRVRLVRIELEQRGEEGREEGESEVQVRRIRGLTSDRATEEKRQDGNTYGGWLSRFSRYRS